MARDLLCIPLAGVGVERTFNFARDMCHYRRGHLKPETIRLLLLLYHSQVQENHSDIVLSSLKAITDIRDMSDKDVELEIEAQLEEMDTRNQHIDDWDQDFYISDPEENGPVTRTQRMQSRREYIARKAARDRSRNARSVNQQLSNRGQIEAEEQARRTLRQEQQFQDNPHIYSPPRSSSLSPPPEQPSSSLPNPPRIENTIEDTIISRVPAQAATQQTQELYEDILEPEMDEEMQFYEQEGLLSSTSHNRVEPELPTMRRRRSNDVISRFLNKRPRR